MTLTDGPSVNVAFTTQAQQTVIETTGPDAMLNVAELEQELAKSHINQVVVTTAVKLGALDGQQAGTIVYDGTTAANLTFANAGEHKSLIFRTVDGTNAIGDLTFDGVHFGGPLLGNFGTWVKIDTSAIGGDVVFGTSGVSFQGPGVSSLDIKTGNGNFTYSDAGGAADFVDVVSRVTIDSNSTVSLSNRGELRSGFDMFVRGNPILLGTSLESSLSCHLSGPVVLTLDSSISATEQDGSIGFGQAVNGHFDLTLAADRIDLPGDTGFTTTLGTVTIPKGRLSFFVNSLLGIRADLVVVGDDVVDNLPAILGADAEIHADVLVKSDGRIDPGRREPDDSVTPATLHIFGDVTFAGGALVLDLGSTSDLLYVHGNLDIGSARLGGGAGSGHLPDASEVQVVRYTGALTGQFINAPIDTAVQVAADAVRVTNYGPALTGITIARIPSLTGSKFSGTDGDGTKFTVNLSGGGELVTNSDAISERFLLVRNSTENTRLTITPTGTAIDDIVLFDAGIIVDGPLVSLRGPRVDVGRQLRILGSASAIIVRDMLGHGETGIQVGGDELDRLTLIARDIIGDLRVRETLRILTARDVGGTISAPVVITSRLRDFTGSFLVTGGLETSGALTTFVARDVEGTVKSASIGVFRVSSVQSGSRIEASNWGTRKIGAIVVAGDFSGRIVAVGVKSFSAGAFLGEIAIDRSFFEGDIGSFIVRGEADGRIVARQMHRFDSGGGRVVLAMLNSIDSIRSRGDLAAQIAAFSTGPVIVAGRLSGLDDWKLGGSIYSIRAAAIEHLNVNAAHIRSLTVTGNVKAEIGGDIVESDFDLNGASTINGSALGTVFVAGNVRNSRFQIRGSVYSFTAARFLGSRLYLDYTPDAAFNVSGSFNSPITYRLRLFVTTSKPTGDPLTPDYWAFQDSEIVADTIGAIRLSGLKTENGGVPFGIKSQSNAGSVRVAAADDPAIIPNTNLSTQPNALAGAFYFLDI